MNVYRKALLLIVFFVTPLYSAPSASTKPPIEQIFSQEQTIQFVLDIESALAQAQAQLGIIPQEAANEIQSKASTNFVTIEEWNAENAKVNHRMVAILNVWTKKMNNGAGEYVHLGATTVDIYDTVLVLQMDRSIRLMIKELEKIEDILIITHIPQ